MTGGNYAKMFVRTACSCNAGRHAPDVMGDTILVA